ncbi:class I adenylate-forming enzyme family protein [Streptomyces sp. NPDC051018]|uniref:class I adenylate-forming enzyme family protein n=1 Tax=Streptomyces sp. NPDC051018 TaxID=3365639 RepID=UPI00378A138A
MTALSYRPADTGRPVLENTCGGVLRDAAAAAPDTVALAEFVPPGETGRQWTYAALLRDAERAAAWLLERFSSGERVAVWSPNLPEWVLLQYGAGLAGIVLVTANPALREAELAHLLRQSGAAGVVYLESFRGTDMAAVVDRIAPGLPALRERVGFTGWYDGLGDTPLRPLPEVAPGSAAQIQYTSGTTGAPKGAVLHHRGLVTNADFVAARVGFPEGGVWVSALPLFHTAGCGLTVLGAAQRRGTLVLPPFYEPGLILSAMRHWRADTFGGVPAMLGGLLAHPEFDSYDLSACERIMSGGDSVPAPMVTEAERRFGARFSTVYGQTELSPIVAQTSPDDTIADKTTTTGQPLWQAEMKVIDPASGDIVPAGVPGEICARGYQVMLGYHEQPDATAAAVDGDGWLHTGDLGTMDERGYLTVTGRLKDMIIRGGENIYPAEIETALLRHPAVRAAVVLGVPDDGWGEQVAAVVTPADPERPPTAAELHEYLRAGLAPHKTPRHWYLAEAVPANAMGKIQKFLLRDRLADLPRLP